MQTFKIEPTKTNLPVSLKKTHYLSIKSEVFSKLDLSNTTENRYKLHMNSDNKNKSLSFALEFVSDGRKPKSSTDSAITVKVDTNAFEDEVRKHPNYSEILDNIRDSAPEGVPTYNLPYLHEVLHLDKLEYKVEGNILFIEVPYKLDNSLDFVVN